MDKSNSKNEYWISLNQFKTGKVTEAFKHEFPEQVKEEFDPKKKAPMSRRRFMALLGASSAFAAASCSDYRDKGEIVTYNNKTELNTMGEALFYASTLNDGQGVLIKTREGRPIKIDGNPDHPISKGKLSQQGQAEILDLYDPQRLQQPLRKSESGLALHKADMNKKDWTKIDTEIVAHINKVTAAGKEIAIIGHDIKSPTQNKLIDDFTAKYPTSKYYGYDLFSDRNRRMAWKDLYGTAEYLIIDWKKPNIILALESDFLGNEGNVEEASKEFASRRDINNVDGFNRLYCVDATLSQTGLNADYRLRLSPEYQLDFVLGLGAVLIKEMNLNLDQKYASLFKGDIHSLASKTAMNLETIKHLIHDLKDNKGKSLIYAGDKLPKDVHIAVNLLNQAMQNDIYKISRAVKLRKCASDKELQELVAKLNAGKVGLLINFDANPVFHLPKELGFAEAAKKAEMRVSLLSQMNESADKNDHILSVNHALESWNDFQLRHDYISLQQPVIAPLYNTRQKEAILLNWMSEKPEEYQDDIYHKYVMKRWEEEVYTRETPASDFRKFWLSSLHDGSIILRNPIPDPTLMMEIVLPEIKFTKTEKQGFTVILTNNYTVMDGRYANNGWLQELPHPVSKVAWDNYAAIAPKTATELGLENNDIISVEVNGRKLNIPIIEQPGTAEKTVVIELGYGRSIAGDVGKGVGFDSQILLGLGGISKWIYTGAKISKTGETYELVSTQEHHPVDDEQIKDFHFSRDVVREATVKDYKKNPDVVDRYDHEFHSITPDREYKGIKWGMAIDMNKCTGCTNCTMSCNVENNIPVVGKEEVGKGREMHWMRIDRYYSGTPEEPKVSTQPILCQHCDLAPCENVCPVVATTHSDDGINQMVYNRCVGTRYCANNCPFKVRRFNFFNFRADFKDGYYENDSLKLLHNPEVTVRSRGVMEKCTFCIQRINDAKQEALKEGREMTGDDVKTACQISCPADAIVFGDINDPESDVSKLREHKLGYHMLEMMNIKPNVTYLARLRNTHMEENNSEH